MNIIKRLGWKRTTAVVILSLGGALAFRIYGSFERHKDRAPDPGTDEYFLLHGLVPGESNEIKIGEHTLRFPAENFPEPSMRYEQVSDIIRGKTDHIVVHLDVSNWAGLPPRIHRHRAADAISIEYERSTLGEADFDKHSAEFIRTQQWISVTELPDIGLKRFQNREGGWGYLTYIPISSDTTSPLGVKPVFYCTGYQSLRPTECRTAFVYSNSLLIRYFFSGQFLPRWREIDHKVMTFVASTIVSTHH